MTITISKHAAERAAERGIFENHDFGDDMREAEKRGELFVSKAGESAYEALKKHKAAKRAAIAAAASKPRRAVAAAML